MKIYINEDKGDKTFYSKKSELKKTINEALFMLDSFGTPIKDLTPRRMERMALCILALADVKKSSEWKNTKDISQGVSMKSRDIINYINKNLQDKISLGSYDDIRRKDLKLAVLNGVVVRTKPGSARNDSTRGYAISKEHAELMRNFGKSDWVKKLSLLLKGQTTLMEKLSEEREMEKIPIILPNGGKLQFSPGEHNLLQKAIIEDFLPRFGYGAEVLYVGDTADKFLYMDETKLKELKFFELSHGELPDIIAYCKEKNWLFLIEAVHSFGPISKTRYLELQELTKDCSAEIIFVTAFPDRATFRTWVADIAWETEVWIAESPDHLIHFNGDKFLGPHKK